MSTPNPLLEELNKAGIKKVTVFEANESHPSSSCSAPTHSCVDHESFSTYACRSGDELYFFQVYDEQSC